MQPPTSAEIATADYGAYPTNYEEIVKRYYSNVLKDPDSVQYRRIVHKGRWYVGDAPISYLTGENKGIRYGYLVCVTLNGKNSYGAYTGFKTEGLLIRNGVVIEYLDAERFCI